MSSRSLPARPRGNPTATLQVLPTTVYLIIFFLIPVLVLFIYSFWRKEGFEFVRVFTLENYQRVLSSDLYLNVTINSLTIGLLTSLLTTILGYPLAYAVTFRFRRYRSLLLLLIFVSVIGSYLSRIYAWKSILGARGLINEVLLTANLIDEPLTFLVYNRGAVIITLTNLFVPYAFLPIYSALQNINPNLLEAARDLGATPGKVFWKVTLPLSISGVIAGFIYTLIFTSSDFVATSLLGGRNGLMISTVIADQFGLVYNWPLGSALATFLLLTLVGVFWITNIVLKALRVQGLQA